MRTSYSLRVLLLIALVQTSIAAVSLGQESLIRVGDRLILEIKGVPIEDRQELSSTYIVGDDGAVHMPHLHSGIRAVGITPSNLSRSIERSYVAAQIYTNPKIVISPVVGEVTQQRVVVVGEVRAPHQVPYAPGMTLLEAISACQGFTDFAKEREIKLIRDQKTVVHDLTKISKNPGLDPTLKPGDRIIVPQRGPFDFRK